MANVKRYLDKIHREDWEYPCQLWKSPLYINYMFDWRALAIQDDPDCLNEQKTQTQDYAIFPRFLIETAAKIGFEKTLDFVFCGSFRRACIKGDGAKKGLDVRKWIIGFAQQHFTNESVFKRTGGNEDAKEMGFFYQNTGKSWDYTDDEDKEYHKLKSLGINMSLSKEMYKKMRKYSKDNQEKNGYLFPGMGFDYLFYLCKSKFSLCPAGDMPWSVRFYESIMCKSIPIVKKESETYRTLQESLLDYKYYLYDDTEFEYRKDWADHNFQLFLKYHSLL